MNSSISSYSHNVNDFQYKNTPIPHRRVQELRTQEKVKAVGSYAVSMDVVKERIKAYKL